MADGLSVADADAALTTAVANALFVQLHTGAPGAAGTSNVSSTTTREAVTWGTPASGSVSATNQPAWPAWAGTPGEVVTHISFWSLATGGAFQFSTPIAPSETMNTGDTLTMTALAVAFPVAS